MHLNSNIAVLLVKDSKRVPIHGRISLQFALLPVACGFLSFWLEKSRFVFLYFLSPNLRAANLISLVLVKQTYTKSGSILEGMRQKEKELEQWLPFRKLSQNLQQQIKYHLHSWDETRNFNIENLVYNLPEDLGRDIKSELCLELLKKVRFFSPSCLKLLKVTFSLLL